MTDPIIVTDTHNKEDEKFNDTLKRMLKTPHEPHKNHPEPPPAKDKAEARGSKRTITYKD